MRLCYRTEHGGGRGVRHQGRGQGSGLSRGPGWQNAGGKTGFTGLFPSRIGGHRARRACVHAAPVAQAVWNGVKSAYATSDAAPARGARRRRLSVVPCAGSLGFLGSRDSDRRSVADRLACSPIRGPLMNRMDRPILGVAAGVSEADPAVIAVGRPPGSAFWKLRTSSPATRCAAIRGSRPPASRSKRSRSRQCQSVIECTSPGRSRRLRADAGEKAIRGATPPNRGLTREIRVFGFTVVSSQRQTSAATRNRRGQSRRIALRRFRRPPWLPASAGRSEQLFYVCGIDGPHPVDQPGRGSGPADDL